MSRHTEKVNFLCWMGKFLQQFFIIEMLKWRFELKFISNFLFSYGHQFAYRHCVHVHDVLYVLCWTLAVKFKWITKQQKKYCLCSKQYFPFIYNMPLKKHKNIGETRHIWNQNSSAPLFSVLFPWNETKENTRNMISQLLKYYV